MKKHTEAFSLMFLLCGAMACADVDPSASLEGEATDQDAGVEADPAGQSVPGELDAFEDGTGDGSRPKTLGAGFRVSWQPTFYLRNNKTWPIADCTYRSTLAQQTTTTMFTGGWWNWTGQGITACDGKYTMAPIRFDVTDATHVKVSITNKLYANGSGSLRKTSPTSTLSIFIPLNQQTTCVSFDDLNYLSWSDWSGYVDAMSVCVNRAN